MSVTVRPYCNAGWEADIRILLPDGTQIRERRKVSASGKSAALRWAEARERVLLVEGKPKPLREEVRTTTTLKDFAPRFLEGYAKANRQKPSGIAAKETILRVHLVPLLGNKPLDAITTEDVQRLKSALSARSAKTVNNVLTVLNVVMKTAVQWNVIDSVPCSVRLLPIAKSGASFHDFHEYERLIASAQRDGQTAYLIVLLGGDAGLRCGEIMALEWTDVDLGKRLLCIARSEWKGQVTVPKGGRIRYVPLTTRVVGALREARHFRNARVVCDSQGKPLTQKVVQGVMRRVARKAKARPGVHILRHTFCSHLAMRGAPARAIQELAGHQDLTTTQRYMHLSPAALDAAIRLLDSPGVHPNRGEIREAAGTGG